MNIFSLKDHDISFVLNSLRRPVTDTAILEETVTSVFTAVKTGGDAAVLDLTLRYDRAVLKSLKVTKAEIAAAEKEISPKLKMAIRTAMENIELFHRSQLAEEKIVGTMPGVWCWQRPVPIERVGLYIPGGTAPLFSTVMMLAVPARVAGCSEVVLCTPPRRDGTIHPAILYTASLSGVTTIFKAGGIQAIAAMAYGTESVPRVDKIFGPGNQWVTAAKQMASKDGIAIDLPAGPSEVMIVADDTAIPAFIASDMLSQAEHGDDSQAVLVTTSAAVSAGVMVEIDKQSAGLKRLETINKSLASSAIVIVEDLDSVVEIMNAYAPEHLILSVADPSGLASRVRNAGSVFLGNYSPESAGDYASGTNHTLPTNGFARGWSGVSLDSFMKKITFQNITAAGLLKLGPVVETLAEAEQLDAHANAIRVRIDQINKK
ncbi:MAG: histidinol dehydrogenase [Bacteroidales bacterium]|nr:histidinol dehydrogenase [Bacteroidales bacterium]